MMRPDMKRLLSQDLNDEVTCAGACVEIDQHDLLPGAQQQRAVGEGDGNRRALELASQMTMAVVFTRIFLVVLPGRDRRGPPDPRMFSYRP